MPVAARTLVTGRGAWTTLITARSFEEPEVPSALLHDGLQACQGADAGAVEEGGPAKVHDDVAAALPGDGRGGGSIAGARTRSQSPDRCRVTRGPSWTTRIWVVGRPVAAAS